MSAETFDLAVVGAGPAGAAAALVAGRAGLTVGLFEPQAMPADKPCGEGIMPAGVNVLRALGLAHLLERGAPLGRIRYVLASGRTLEIALPPGGVAIERSELERALLAALEREPGIRRVQARVRDERAPAAQAGEAPFRLSSGDRAWRAHTLIAADGVQGQAAGWLRRPRGSSRRIGLRARARLARPLSSVEVHLGGRAGTGGCEVYLTPLPGRRVNVAVLLDRARAAAPQAAQRLFEDALRQHPLAAASLGELVTAPELRALGRARPHDLARAGAFLAGDAAGGVDPVLGCGVALALCSGRAAGAAAAEVRATGSGAPERRYARYVAEETRLRARIAGSLVFLAAHPALQEGLAHALRAAPFLARSLARRIAG
jgi:flavin-dependent dehydrogenase